MRHALQIAVLADDLTGAADTGVQFCPAVGPVHLADAASGTPSAGAVRGAGLSLFTGTRHLDPPTAARIVRQVGEAVYRLAPRRVYKKVDSGLRGNLGAEIDSLLEATGAEASFIAPAFPQHGRTTVDDRHLVHGVPVADTEIGRDPLCPVRESHLSRLLAAQSRQPVGRVPLGVIDRGGAELARHVRALMDRGCRHITFDAVLDAHLDAVAGLVAGPFEKILPVGSAGLAASLARRLAPGVPPPARPVRPRITRWLLVCGSASAALAGQAAALARATGWVYRRLDPATLGGSTADRRRLVDGLAEAWQTSGLIAGLEPMDASGPREDPARVVQGLARVAADLLRIGAPEGVFLSGGDTAEAFWRQIAAPAVLVHEAVLPGVMHGVFSGGAVDGLPVVTKAGAFGSADTLIQLIEAFT